MAVDFLVDRSRGWLRAVVIAAITGVSLGVLGVMLWFGVMMVGRAQFQMLAGVLNPFTGEGVSIATVYAAIPIGAAIAIVGVLARAIEQIRVALSNAPPLESRREIFEV